MNFLGISVAGCSLLAGVYRSTLSVAYLALGTTDIHFNIHIHLHRYLCQGQHYTYKLLSYVKCVEVIFRKSSLTKILNSYLLYKGLLPVQFINFFFRAMRATDLQVPWKSFAPAKDDFLL